MEKLSVMEKVADRFQLPADMLGIMKLTVTGRSRVMVENHRGITEYSHELIEVSGGAVRLRLRGDDLQLLAMDSTALLIGGRLLALELE